MLTIAMLDSLKTNIEIISDPAETDCTGCETCIMKLCVHTHEKPACMLRKAVSMLLKEADS